MQNIDTTPARPPRVEVVAHATASACGALGGPRSCRERFGHDGRNVGDAAAGAGARRDILKLPGAAPGTVPGPCYSRGSGGTPSAGSAAFNRRAMSSRLTRLRCGTSSSANQRASSLDPSTSLRSSPPVTLAR